MEVSLDQGLVTDLAIPPRPRVVTALFEEMSKDDPDLGRAVKEISADVGMAAAMIKAVNSAAFGLSRKVSSVSQAVGLLGLRNVTNIATGLAIRHSIAGGANGNLERFWDAAEQVALIAARLAKLFRGIPADEAYTLGLFHDCGIPLLMRRFKNYGDVLAQAARTPGICRTDPEEAAFNTNHAVVGWFMARSWELPDGISQAILRHHELGFYEAADALRDGHLTNLVALIQLAEHVHQMASHEPLDREWDKFSSAVLGHFGLHEEDYLDIVEEFGQNAQDR